MSFPKRAMCPIGAEVVGAEVVGAEVSKIRQDNAHIHVCVSVKIIFAKVTTIGTYSQLRGFV